MRFRLTSAALAAALACATTVLPATALAGNAAPPPVEGSNPAAKVVAADVNAREADGSTALHWAVYHGDLPKVQQLLKAGAQVDAANNYGATPMQLAATVGDARILGVLLKAGANVDSPTQEGQTALMAVARTGNLDAAKLLLRHGAKVDARESWGGQTALIWAAAQSQPAMIRLLLEHRADPNARATVRDWARRVTAEGRPKDMNRGGLTPLLYAAREGCIDCAKALLARKADIDIADPDGTTALLLALMNLHWDFARYLIDAGADVNLWDLYGQTPLYAAVDLNTLPQGGRADVPSADPTSGIDVIKLLLDRGANPNAQLKLRPPFRNVPQDRQGDPMLTIGATPLLRAAKAGDVVVTQLLLEHGALVNLPNELGMTPFMAAAGMSPGSNPSRGRFRTQEDAIATLELLHAAGADVNATSRRGETAMHSAAGRGWNEVIKVLVGWGGKLDAREIDNLTPIDYAMGRVRVGFLIPAPPPMPQTAALLRELGAKEENPKLPPWPALPTPQVTSQVPE